MHIHNVTHLFTYLVYVLIYLSSTSFICIYINLFGTPPQKKNTRPHGNYKEPHLRRRKAAAQGLEFEDLRRGIL